MEFGSERGVVCNMTESAGVCDIALIMVVCNTSKKQRWPQGCSQLVGLGLHVDQPLG